jgi:hypothetical protein
MQIDIENLKGLLGIVKNVREELSKGQTSIVADFQLKVVENSLENWIGKEEKQPCYLKIENPKSKVKGRNEKC